MGDQRATTRTVDLVRSRSGRIAGLAFALLALPYFVPVFDTESLYWYADVWSVVALVGVVLALLVVSRPREAPPRERAFWGALSAGFACWFAGRLCWGVFHDYGLATDLVADFLFTCLYVGILVALEMDPDRPASTEFQRRMRSCTIAGGVVLLVAAYGYFALVPALVSPATYESWAPAAYGAVFFDGYVMIRLFARFRRTEDPRWRRIYGWMAAGFAAWVVTDVLHLFWLFNPQAYVDAGTPVDLFWFAPYMTFAVGVLAGRTPANASSPGMVTPPRLGRFPGGTPLVPYTFSLPLIHAGLYLSGLGEAVLRPWRVGLLVVEGVVLAALIFVAHRMVLRENLRLQRSYEKISRSLSETNRDLEARVRRRTAELEDANRRLATDIEQRVRVEELLRGAEARNRALIHALPDALVLVDHAGVVRDVFPSRSGPDRLDLAGSRGRPLGDLLPEAIRPELERTLDRIRRGETQLALPVTVPVAGGQLHLELRCGRCGPNEILVLVQDVTERREFESSLQQSQKLESLGIMAGGIAHDFNNLLASILGNAQLARESLTGDESPDHLRSIESSALRAAKLTDNLLAYAGEAHIDRRPLDLGRLFADLDTLLAVAVPKRLRFTAEIGQEELWVVGNEAQLTQILLNLVRNAAEALDGGDGEISVRLARCRVERDGVSVPTLGGRLRAGNYVRLRVEDTGCGMEAEVARRIFEPFFTSKETGRGLGLAAVLGIVSHHDGALTLETAPGRGTVFEVYLPECEASARDRVSRPDGLEPQGSGTIVVVDDDADVRDLLVSFLKKTGFDVLEAVNGREAVALVAQKPGALAAVVMDYAMPELNGVEAHRRIRELDPQVPVLMLSGYGEREALGTLHDAHRTAYLHKPFELTELGAALQELLAVRKHESEA